MGEAVFYGVAFSPGGKRAWASGGGQNVVHVYAVGKGLREIGHDPGAELPRRARLRQDAAWRPHLRRQQPLRPGGHLQSAGALGHRHRPEDQPRDGDDRPRPGAAALRRHVQPQGEQGLRDELDGPVRVGHRHAHGDACGGGSCSRPPNNPLLADHPNAIAANPRRNEVYTANGNSDTVSFIDTRRDRVIKTTEGRPGQRRAPGRDTQRASPSARTGGGSTWRSGARTRSPSSTSTAAGGSASSRRPGTRPTSTSPATASKLAITTANAAGRRPRRCAGPYAVGDCTTGDLAYSSRQDPARARRAASASCAHRRRARAAAPAHARSCCATTACAPAARRSRAWLGAIRHVIYVVKENRTYDQVLGDIGKGDGDPGLVLFDEDSAPNHRELARRFTLFDNFFADADVSADGQSWTVAAGVTDYIDKMWPITYSPGVAAAAPRARLRARRLRRPVLHGAARRSTARSSAGRPR